MKIKSIIYIFLSLIIVFTLFKSIFYPSYLSVASACGGISNEELSDLGYEIAGVTSVRNGNITIEIFVEDEDNKHKKHEWVHFIQLQSFPSLSCEHKVQKYLGEVQAYSMSYLPDWMFKKLFGDFEKSESLSLGC